MERLCAVVAGSDFALWNVEIIAEGNHLKAGQAILLSGDPLPLCQTEFSSACARQNAQGKDSTEGSKKQDKRRASQVAPARVTSTRSAGRFKGFRDLERGRMRGSHLNLGAHLWGLILRKWPSLAALSGGHYGDTGQNRRFERSKK